MIVSFLYGCSSLFAENNLDLRNHHASQGVGVSLPHTATRRPGALGMHVSLHVHITISVLFMCGFIIYFTIIKHKLIPCMYRYM